MLIKAPNKTPSFIQWITFLKRYDSLGVSKLTALSAFSPSAKIKTLIIIHARVTAIKEYKLRDISPPGIYTKIKFP